MLILDNVRIDVTADDSEELNVEAWLDQFKVGYLNGERDGERLKLSDIYVEESIQRRWPLHIRLRQHLGLWAPPQLRKKGIGGAMLNKVLERCRSNGVREVWGWVRTADVHKTPNLLEWYAKRGFTIKEPDTECDGAAFKKIVLKL